jgi:hypothetical protein
MTQVQGATALHCPRCGGPMLKPAGSTLYWHVDNKHPRCDITNIVESVLEIQTPKNDPPDKPKRQPKK